MSQNKEAPFTFNSDIIFTVPSHQRYPTDVYKWIKKNANPRMSLKLMQVCKYFCFKQFPFLVTYTLEWFEEDAFNYAINFGYVNKRMKMPCKEYLWITRVLELKNYPSILPNLLKSMVVCGATYIHFERQQISFKDFKILTASGTVEILHCYGNTMICDDSGNVAPLEDIFECLPKLERLVFSAHVPSLTTSNISELKVSPNIDFVQFSITEEPFNFDNFVKFMKMYPKTRYNLEYFYDLSQKFKEKLQTFVDEIVKNGLTEFPPTIIEFDGQNKMSLRALKELHNSFFSQ